MKFGWIEAGVLAASACPADAAEIRWLHEQGIRAIVSLTEHSLTTQEPITPELFRELDITYLHAPMRDFMPPGLARALGVIEFIREMRGQRRPALVHCMAGEGRTGTMLHVYYLAQGMSLDDAKSRVMAVRPTSAFGSLSGSQQRFLEEFAASFKT